MKILQWLPVCLAASMMSKESSSSSSSSSSNDLIDAFYADPLSVEHDLSELWQHLRPKYPEAYAAYERYHFAKSLRGQWVQQRDKLLRINLKATIDVQEMATFSVSTVNGLIRTTKLWIHQDGSKAHSLLFLYLNEQHDFEAISTWLKLALERDESVAGLIARLAALSFGSLEGFAGRLSEGAQLALRQKLKILARPLPLGGPTDREKEEEERELIKAVEENPDWSLLACLIANDPNHPDCLLLARTVLPNPLAWQYSLQWRWGKVNNSWKNLFPWGLEHLRTLSWSHALCLWRVLSQAKLIPQFLLQLHAHESSSHSQESVDPLSTLSALAKLTWLGQEKIVDGQVLLPGGIQLTWQLLPFLWSLAPQAAADNTAEMRNNLIKRLIDHDLFPQDSPSLLLQWWRHHPHSEAWMRVPLTALPLCSLLKDCQLRDLQAWLEQHDFNYAALRQACGEEHGLLIDLLEGKEPSLTALDDYFVQQNPSGEQASRIFEFI